MSIILTCFTKNGGPLTKEISISNGMLKSDGSKCVMGQGHAQRMRLDNLGQLGELMASIKSNQALGLGRLRDDLPDCVRIITKAAAAKLNGSLPPDIITRTADAIYYTPGEASIALIDFDQKGMPASVRARVAAAGGCEGVLATIVPELATCGRVVRPAPAQAFTGLIPARPCRVPAACTSFPSSRTDPTSNDSFGRCTSVAGLLVVDGTSSVQPASYLSVASSIKWCMRRSASSSKLWPSSARTPGAGPGRQTTPRIRRSTTRYERGVSAAADFRTRGDRKAQSPSGACSGAGPSDRHGTNSLVSKQTN